MICVHGTSLFPKLFIITVTIILTKLIAGQISSYSPKYCSLALSSYNSENNNLRDKSGVNFEGNAILEDEHKDSDKSLKPDTYYDRDELNSLYKISDTQAHYNIQRVIRSSGKNDQHGLKIWDQWGKWSGCSVTCGAGKLTRWRHCIGGSCAIGEKKAQLKTCTYPAC